MRRGAALVVLCVSSRAFALDPPFGARGQVVITENANANVTWTGYDSGAHFFNANLAPSVDWFAFKDVSFGADAHVGYAKNRAFDANSQLFDYEASATSFGLRAAVNVPFSRWISLWPRATVYFAWSQSTVDPGFSPVTTTIMGTTLTLYAPLLFHLRSHFFVGFGPQISHTFDYVVGGNGTPLENTALSLHTLFGGTIGGERSPHDDEVPVPWRPFGEEHETVIDGTVDWTDVLVQNSSSRWSMTLAAGLDHFVMQHLSVGVGAGFGYSNFNVTNVPVPFTQEQWQVYLAPRVGYDIPISPRFSFYPRASLGFAATSNDLRSSTGENSNLSLLVYVSAYAPVLYHAAPHFFVGFGPTIYRELVDKDPRYNTASGNIGTSLGAAFSVGGWL